MATRDASEWTVADLKEELKKLGLPTTGNKHEMITRLLNALPSGTGIREVPETRDTARTEAVNVMTFDRELIEKLERMDRDKRLIQEELDGLRQEVTLLRGSSESQAVPAAGAVGGSSQPRINVSGIAELLATFDGTTGNVGAWTKQLKLLKRTYKLDDEHTRILIGMRLRGRAQEWLYSKPEYLEVSTDTLLYELKKMFDHRPNVIMLRKEFEGREWKRGETFSDYMHHKVILGNRISINEDEMVEYIIDGIPDRILRDQARVSGHRTKAALLEAFDRITLWEKKYHAVSTARRGEQQKPGDKAQRQRGGERPERKNSSRDEAARRCFNCGMRDHISADCPTKVEGPRCFECGERGHIASKCVKRQRAVRSIENDVRTVHKKCNKEVEINGNKMLALIDTGSDICLLRSDKYIRLGFPKLDLKEVQFRGVGSKGNSTLGEFYANLTTDGNTYPILVRVVSDTLLSCELIIGADFLNTVEMTIKGGEITINPLPELSRVDETVPEIFQISLDSKDDDEIIDVTHVPNAEQRTQIEDLIASYTPSEPRDVDLKMSIVLKDEEPVYQRARRLSAPEKEQVNAQINEWIRDGIVQPSLSEYASPIVLARKKDGSFRLCVDYRLLNRKVIKDRYPLPLIEDQLDQLQDARYFTTLDLKNGFFHVAIDERSRKYTAFIVPDGHYEFLRVPFGLCNSPAVFQRYINIVFRDLIRAKIVLVYIDDIIVPSKDYESGIMNLCAVLKVASEAGLIINWKKCNFLKSRVEFLGHIIEGGRVYPSEHKLEAVRKFPEPANAKQLQSFLGLSGYFRKFIPQYSTIARPLSDLLKANVEYIFDEKQRDAFVQLKEMLINKPVLNLYVIGAETELHTDASMYGFGAILLQKSKEDSALHPIYYYSSKTTTAEQKYSSYELEVLAIIRALKRFRVYLIGIPFTIVTDCRAFTATMNKKDLCVRVARWALLLEEFNYKIEHRPGKNMIHVDALSRYPIECNVIERPKDELIARLKKAQEIDDDIRKIFDRGKLARARMMRRLSESEDIRGRMSVQDGRM